MAHELRGNNNRMENTIINILDIIFSVTKFLFSNKTLLQTEKFYCKYCANKFVSGPWTFYLEENISGDQLGYAASGPGNISTYQALCLKKETSSLLLFFNNKKSLLVTYFSMSIKIDYLSVRYINS